MRSSPMMPREANLEHILNGAPDEVDKRHAPSASSPFLTTVIVLDRVSVSFIVCFLETTKSKNEWTKQVAELTRLSNPLS